MTFISSQKVNVSSLDRYLTEYVLPFHAHSDGNFAAAGARLWNIFHQHYKHMTLVVECSNA